MTNCNSARPVYFGYHSGMPLFSRLGLISLLFLPLVSLAQITCVEQPDGSWVCSGYGGGSGQGEVSTNANAHATICATNFTITISPVLDGLSLEDSALIPRVTCEELQYYSSSYDYSSLDYEYSSFMDSINQLSDNPDIDYSLIQPLFQSFENVYNEAYYNVAELNSINELVSSFDCSSINVETVAQTNTSVVCTQCYASNGDGGDGGDGGNSGTCSECPCADLLTAIYNEIYTIRQKLEAQYNLLKKIHSSLTSIAKDMAYISTNNFRYANEFKTKDGYAFDLKSRYNSVFQNTNSIFGSSYSDLNWMSRVELLLMRISGVDGGGSTSNGVNGISSDSVEDLKDGLEDTLDTIKDKIDSVKDTYTTNLDGLKTVFEKVKDLFNTGSPPSEITLYQGSDWLGGESLTFELSDTIVDGCRICSQLVWSCLACVIFFYIVMYTLPVMVRLVKFVFNLFFKILS